MPVNDLFSLFESPDDKRSIGEKQSLDTLSDVKSEQDFIVRKSSLVSDVDLLIDYSSFSNFVKFSSAYEIFTVTSDTILNRYPDDGTIDDLESFKNSLDGYQRYVLTRWPKQIGHLRFNPASASYIKVEDVGIEEGVTKTSFLSPGTGSISIQAWAEIPTLTGSNDVFVVFQKQNSSGDGYTLYASGSTVRFKLVSGSSNVEVSCSIGSGPTFYAGVCDRGISSGTLYMITGSTISFPVITNSSSITFGGRFDIGSGSFFIGSGSVSGKTVRPFTGSLDDISAWSNARTISSLTSSYNRKVYSQEHLIGCWRFNESQQIPSTNPLSSIVRDTSGKRLDGRIINYHSAIRGSGSFAYDSPDPILSLDDSNVLNYVVQQQTSGSTYDRGNQYKLIDMIPPRYLQEDSSGGTNLIRNFLYVMGRQYDQIKIFIDQLSYFMTVNHGNYDQVPDSLLDELSQFFGLKLDGSHSTADAVKNILGRGILEGPEGNKDLDTKLYEIKNKIWRRLLLDLSYLYKTKGTKDSIESVMRLYGINPKSSFVKVKEYGGRVDRELVANRINSEKSTYAAYFGTGSLSGSVFCTGSTLRDYTVETRLRIPTTASSPAASILSGTIWTLERDSGNESLRWERTSFSSETGSLILKLPQAALTCSNVIILNNKWYNIAVLKETITGSYTISVKRLDVDEIVYSTSSYYQSSVITGFNSSIQQFTRFLVGKYDNQNLPEHWLDEVRLWDYALSEKELTDHCFEYQSYGSNLREKNSDLLLHWRLNEGVSASNGTTYHTDVSTNNRTGTGSYASSFPYTKFLNEYNFIAPPDLGRTDDSIFIYDGYDINNPVDVNSLKTVSIEFNMIDALNEDISQLLSSYDEMNDIVGYPVNRYREDYPGLEAMRRTYFKRLQGRLRFNVFTEMLDFFDRSFVSIAKQFVPARVDFTGDEIAIESHMLERPKVQYGIRPVRDDIIEIEGSMDIFGRDE